MFTLEITCSKVGRLNGVKCGRRSKVNVSPVSTVASAVPVVVESITKNDNDYS